MRMLLLLTSFVVLPLAFAHDDHDWRMDYEAYLNVNIEAPMAQKSFRRFSAPKRVDMEYFKTSLAIFASVERKSNANLDISRNFLTEEYKKLGFEVSLHPFGSGTNFVAEKKGTKNPEKVLVISSHIDSVGNKGANDNGTGTIGALAVAKELSEKQNMHCVYLDTRFREYRQCRLKSTAQM